MKPYLTFLPYLLAHVGWWGATGQNTAQPAHHVHAAVVTLIKEYIYMITSCIPCTRNCKLVCRLRCCIGAKSLMEQTVDATRYGTQTCAHLRNMGAEREWWLCVAHDRYLKLLF